MTPQQDASPTNSAPPGGSDAATRPAETAAKAASQLGSVPGGRFAGFRGSRAPSKTAPSKASSPKHAVQSGADGSAAPDTSQAVEEIPQRASASRLPPNVIHAKAPLSCGDSNAPSASASASSFAPNPSLVIRAPQDQAAGSQRVSPSAGSDAKPGRFAGLRAMRSPTHAVPKSRPPSAGANSVAPPPNHRQSSRNDDTGGCNFADGPAVADARSSRLSVPQTHGEHSAVRQNRGPGTTSTTDRSDEPGSMRVGPTPMDQATGDVSRSSGSTSVAECPPKSSALSPAHSVTTRVPAGRSEAAQNLGSGASPSSGSEVKTGRFAGFRGLRSPTNAAPKAPTAIPPSAVATSASPSGSQQEPSVNGLAAVGRRVAEGSGGAPVGASRLSWTQSQGERPTGVQNRGSTNGNGDNGDLPAGGRLSPHPSSASASAPAPERYSHSSSIPAEPVGRDAQPLDIQPSAVPNPTQVSGTDTSPSASSGAKPGRFAAFRGVRSPGKAAPKSPLAPPSGESTTDPQALHIRQAASANALAALGYKQVDSPSRSKLRSSRISASDSQGESSPSVCDRSPVEDRDPGRMEIPAVDATSGPPEPITNTLCTAEPDSGSTDPPIAVPVESCATPAETWSNRAQSLSESAVVQANIIGVSTVVGANESMSHESAVENRTRGLSVDDRASAVPPYVEPVSVAPSSTEHVSALPSSADHGSAALSGTESVSVAPSSNGNASAAPSSTDNASAAPPSIDHASACLSSSEHANAGDGRGQSSQAGSSVAGSLDTGFGRTSSLPGAMPEQESGMPTVAAPQRHLLSPPRADENAGSISRPVSRGSIASSGYKIRVTPFNDNQPSASGASTPSLIPTSRFSRPGKYVSRPVSSCSTRISATDTEDTSACTSGASTPSLISVASRFARWGRFSRPLSRCSEAGALSDIEDVDVESTTTDISRPSRASLPARFARNVAPEESASGAMTPADITALQPPSPISPSSQRRRFTELQFTRPPSHLGHIKPPVSPAVRPFTPPPAIAPPPAASRSAQSSVRDSPQANRAPPSPTAPLPFAKRRRFTDIPLASDMPTDSSENPLVPKAPMPPSAPPVMPAFPKITQPPKLSRNELEPLYRQLPTIVNKDCDLVAYLSPMKHLFFHGPLHKLTVLGYICANLAGSKTEQWTAALEVAGEGSHTVDQDVAQLLNKGFVLAGHPSVNFEDIFAFRDELPIAQIAARRPGVPKLHLTGLLNPKPAVEPAPKVPDIDDLDMEFEDELAELIDKDEYEDILDYRRKRAWERVRAWFSWCGGSEKEEWDEHDRIRGAAWLLAFMLFAGGIFLYYLAKLMRNEDIKMSFGIIEGFLICAAIGSAFFGLFMSRKETPNDRKKENKYEGFGDAIRRHHPKKRRKVNCEVV